MAKVRRNPDGTFIGSGNPAGRRPEERRSFMISQTTKDLLELLEQPFEVTKSGKTKKVPAIVAIYDKMIHKAVAGDWQAMKKCVELREKYTISRTETLGKMVEHAQSLRAKYQARDETMPDELWALVEYADQVAVEGQFRAG
jgi:hypothetical protein